MPNELTKSELGLESFKLARKNRTASYVYQFLSMFSGIAAIGFINSNRNVSYAGLGGQLVFMMLSTNHAQRANQQLDRALWLYNKDILFPPGQH